MEIKKGRNFKVDDVRIAHYQKLANAIIPNAMKIQEIKEKRVETLKKMKKHHQ